MQRGALRIRFYWLCLATELVHSFALHAKDLGQEPTSCCRGDNRSPTIVPGKDHAAGVGATRAAGLAPRVGQASHRAQGGPPGYAQAASHTPGSALKAAPTA